MLAELIDDYPLLVPGEVVVHPCGVRRTVVYPAGLYHAARTPGQVSAALAAATGHGAAASLLRGEGFDLLASCCDPPLIDREGPLAELAAASWLRQMAMRPGPAAAMKIPEEGEPRSMPFGEALSMLSEAGHHHDDVLTRPLTGVDGRPLPYPGWTLPQLDYWVGAAMRRQASSRADTISETIAAIAGTFGDERGRDGVADQIAKLREAGGFPLADRAVAPERKMTSDELGEAFPVMQMPPVVRHDEAQASR